MQQQQSNGAQPIEHVADLDAVEERMRNNTASAADVERYRATSREQIQRLRLRGDGESR